jgi:uncharacterized coiled-coil protein SlyX
MHDETPLSQEVWEHIPAEAQAYIRALEARVGLLDETVQGLKATIQQVEATAHQLREQLQQNSRTSSRPPSSDPPQALGQRPHRESRGRRPGGQLGHEGQTRALQPVEAVDVVIPVKPERCSRCQHPLPGEDPHPQRHQDGSHICHLCDHPGDNPAQALSGRPQTDRDLSAALPNRPHDVRHGGLENEDDLAVVKVTTQQWSPMITDRQCAL